MGYILNDNSVSGGKRAQHDTDWCRHCQAVLKKDALKVNGGFCSHCWGPLCLECAKEAITVGCVPFKQKIDREWDRIHRKII